MLRPLLALVALLGILSTSPAARAAPPEETTQPPPLVAPEIAPPGANGGGDGGISSKAAPAITFEERVLELVNLERAAIAGLPPLKGVSELDTSAGTHAFDMADRDFFDHCDLDTKTQPGDRISAAGYSFTTAGENIAAGYATPEDVMAGWLASPGHRANILAEPDDPLRGFREMGVGYFLQADDQATVRIDLNGDCDGDDVVSGVPESGYGPYYRYWTQNFGKRDSVYPLVIDGEAHDTVCAALDLYVWGPADATLMRFSDDGQIWSSWEAYAPARTWTISGASPSPATVFSEVTDGSTTYSAYDSIYLDTGFPLAATVAVPTQTVSSTERFEACDVLSATDGFEVAAGGDVTFRARRKVVLGDGFVVRAGGSFIAIVDSTL